jgi:iron(III) transport system ATP-binding protein
VSNVEIRSVTKSFGSTRVLEAVDLSVPDGGITAVLGASGCGKTTLLRLVAGFLRLDSGEIRIGGRAMAGEGVMVAPQKRGVGYVAQEGALFPHLDVRDNVLFGLPRKERTEARLREMLDLAELPHRVATAYPSELSGGQQQRVAVARALAPRPGVVLLDEPFSSLDTALRESAGRAVVRVLRHAGATGLLVTHDQNEALSLADQVAVMRAGRVAQVSTPVELYRAPHDVDVALFVGGANLVSGTATGERALSMLGELPLLSPVTGEVRLVVRPEQVLLRSEGTDRADGVSTGSVEEVSFYGHDASVRVRLDAPADGVVVSRVTGRENPAVGDRVGVVLDGAVGAYPGEAEERAETSA